MFFSFCGFSVGEPSTFYSCFLFHISLFVAFFDFSSFSLFLFLIRLRFVNHILLLISKSGHYTLLHVAYIIKSYTPPPPFARCIFSVEIANSFMNFFPFLDETDSIFHEDCI